LQIDPYFLLRTPCKDLNPRNWVPVVNRKGAVGESLDSGEEARRRRGVWGPACSREQELPVGRRGSLNVCKDRWTKRGGELGLFQFLKRSKAILTYAMLVRHQFTNRITKLPTQAKRDKTRSKA